MTTHRAKNPGRPTAPPPARPGRGSETARVQTGEARAALHERAYDAIKARIVRLAYRPGMYLNEARISDDLGIGRMPIHMAISRLALENMVEVLPRKGVRVAPMSPDDMLEIMEARLVNEPAAARLAAHRASDQDIALLRSTIRTGRERQRLASDELVDLDRAFHAGIAEAGKNRVLARMLRSLHDRSLRLWYVSWHYESSIESDTMTEHHAVVEAVARGDADAAEQAMRAHLERSIEVVRHLRVPPG